jgi:D-arabinose 1-dehydrogenase-like Zn-dependent alcohol dehydrogenase
MKSMRSVQVSNANGPFELIERKDIPEPNATQVRIKVQACGICHSDSDETRIIPRCYISENSWS